VHRHFRIIVHFGPRPFCTKTLAEPCPNPLSDGQKALQKGYNNVATYLAKGYNSGVPEKIVIEGF